MNKEEKIALIRDNVELFISASEISDTNGTWTDVAVYRQCV